MKPQLWLDYRGGGLDPARFCPVENRGSGWPKPKHGTGLWTSTLDAEGCWIDYCLGYCPHWLPGERNERPVHGAWLLYPDPVASVYTINGYADLAALVERFPAAQEFRRDDERTVDWEAAAREFDAVHLTDAGQWATRLSFPLSLYGWDCESTLWTRFAFESWEQAQLDPIIERRRQAVEYAS